ncbi:hypothetical protein TNCV_1857041 [Trichonephila clavipes]|nr:hypothetical protein TNCV_1857041 [Trichonephila clavipes]
MQEKGVSGIRVNRYLRAVLEKLNSAPGDFGTHVLCVTKSTKSEILCKSKTLICFWSRRPGSSRVSTPRSQTVVSLKTIQSISLIPKREAARLFIVKARSFTAGFPFLNCKEWTPLLCKLKLKISLP